MTLIDKSNFNIYYDLVYFITTYIVILSAISIEIRQDIFIHNKLSKYLVFFPIIILIYIVGYRAYDVGTDTGNYYDYLWLGKPEIILNNEFLFPLIASTLHAFNFSYTYFLF